MGMIATSLLGVETHWHPRVDYTDLGLSDWPSVFDQNGQGLCDDSLLLAKLLANPPYLPGSIHSAAASVHGLLLFA
jgi:hypothetical protein